MKVKSGFKLRGIVERRLYDKYGNAKAQFAPNFLWTFFKKLFKLDIQIPFLTGYWTLNPVRANTITTLGIQKAVELLGGTDTDPATYLAIGEGTPSATALGSEITTGGGERAVATITNETTTLTGDTEQWIKTWTFSAGFDITEEGIFDNVGNIMIASQSFPARTVESGDTFSVTHKIVGE